jgi:DNA-binding SARP family transcriptional activator
MAHVQVRVFGKLRLQNGEAALDVFPTRRVEELFGFLVLNQRARHSREKLIATLWPDVPLSNGRASLSTALWRLRTVFDRIGVPSETYFQATRDWICFQPDALLDVDLSAFERHLANAAEAGNRTDWERSLRAAIEIYQGELCEGIYAEWCLLERERLERCYLRALGQLIALLIQQGQFEKAILLGSEIVRRDPLREEAHRAIMHCHWKLGQRAQAARQFQYCARLLQTELQILPMPETIALYRRIVEDRLNDMWNNGAHPASQRQQLQSAYDSFLMAADTLNLLLEAAEESFEPVTSA